MDHCWNNADMGEPKYVEENLSLHSEKPVPNHLYHGTIFVFVLCEKYYMRLVQTRVLCGLL
jgi:hypothetical protein